MGLFWQCVVKAMHSATLRTDHATIADTPMPHNVTACETTMKIDTSAIVNNASLRQGCVKVGARILPMNPSRQCAPNAARILAAALLQASV